MIVVRSYRLSGKGIGSSRYSTGIVELDIFTPTSLNREQITLLNKFNDSLKEKNNSKISKFRSEFI